MARGKAINVKIATTKVIKALEARLVQIKKDKANQKVNEDKFSKAMEKYNKEIAKIALDNITKAKDLSAHTRYNGELNVSFSFGDEPIRKVPPGMATISKVMPLPKSSPKGCSLNCLLFCSTPCLDIIVCGIAFISFSL